uniref:DNA-directed RNA polymerase III subunit n=1 Tax=Alexandrium monilatum TaxID=311494 RepID=A0A7S4SCW1_9DINO|mmetsp:Transcript_20466/g.64823  ORF Transcript_20466/g.64823 Transcript_20466/m.64823 type:complete len:222 (+) Transcript_20466:88-753(+)
MKPRGKGGGGGGGSRFRGKGGGKGKGGSWGDRFIQSGPILEEPPLYPPEKMRHVPPADFPHVREDIDLISTHRRLLRHWKTSPYFQEAKTAGVTHVQDADLEMQATKIVHSGGVGTAYFPAELLLKTRLKVKGPATEKSILDALRKYESKEGKLAAKGDKATSKEGEEGGAEPEVDPADDVSDEDIGGDDDDVAKHFQFEDGDAGEDSGRDDDGGEGGGDF